MTQGPHGTTWRILLAVVVGIYFFMLAPIVITAAVSFSGSDRSVFPPEGFSLRWWKIAVSEEWLNPVLFSMKLAVASALLSTALALPLSFALVRHRFPGRDALVALSLGPLLLPTLATGVGLLQFVVLSGYGQFLGFGTLLVAHVVICLPLSVRTIGVSIDTLPPSLELAAASLGAKPWQVRWTIIAPLLKNGLTGGLVFCFIHSFTDVNTSLFISSAQEQPITVKILSTMQYGFEPTVAAVSMITIFVPLCAVAIIERMGGFGQIIGGHSR